MAVTLVGEVVNSCDATTGFSAGNISGDDDFVEGTGALGAKISNTFTAFYTTTLGATAPYDASSGGGEFGYHIIMYFGAKSPLNATSGQRIIVGNGTSRGEWDVPLSAANEPKIGIFVSRVIDLAADFSRIAAGSWTTTGNPAQLTNITQVGGGIQTTVSIMGSFNNGQIDQITIGLGVRVDAGTVGAPNTFETVRAQDEDTSKWGWWSSVVGNFVGKGKLFIGPATGSATSVFTDTDFKVVFADEQVAVGFYEIDIRGAGTDVTWTRGNLSSADSTSVRWSLTIDSTTNSFDDTNGIWSGADTLTLDASATLTSTTLIDCSSLVQGGATLDGCTVLEADTADGVAFIQSDNPALISDCSFTFSDGHAIEITTAGTYTFSGNQFTGYGADGTNDAAIYNNSGGAVTLNIAGGGSTPTVRNGASATTTVNNTVPFTLTNVVSGSRLWVVAESGGTLTAGDVMVGPVLVTTDPYNGPSVEASQPFRAHLSHASGSPVYKRVVFNDNTGSGFSRRIEQVED